MRWRSLQTFSFCARQSLASSPQHSSLQISFRNIQTLTPLGSICESFRGSLWSVMDIDHLVLFVLSRLLFSPFTILFPSLDTALLRVLAVAADCDPLVARLGRPAVHGDWSVFRAALTAVRVTLDDLSAAQRGIRWIVIWTRHECNHVVDHGLESVVGLPDFVHIYTNSQFLKFEI